MCSTHRKPFRAVLLGIWKVLWNELTSKKAFVKIWCSLLLDIWKVMWKEHIPKKASFIWCGLLLLDHKGLIFRYLGKEETTSCYCASHHIAAIPKWAEVVCKNKRRIIKKKKKKLRKLPLHWRAIFADAANLKVQKIMLRPFWHLTTALQVMSTG